MDMADYRLEKISNYDFSRYHAVYARENIHMDTDWHALLENAGPLDCGCLLYRDDTPIGGAVFRRGTVSAPFLIPPFTDRQKFWNAVFSLYMPENSLLHLEHIPVTHAEVLLSLGAVQKSGQYRMMRPTALMSPSLDPAYEFALPSECDRNEIIRVIYEAHLRGYTSTINGRPAIEYVRYQTGRRFNAFAKTGTFDMGTIVLSRADRRIIAVCLAGIYPDSPNDFATVHQVSVHPDHRRRGVARAMLMNTISKAARRSPVITLGVLKGNPAMQLYESVGFIAGCEYGDYEYRKI